MTRTLPLLAGLLFAGFGAAAQVAPASSLISRRPDGTPELVRYERADAPATADAVPAMRAALGLGRQSELRAARPAETDELGYTHQRYQQFYQGVPVEFTAYTTHSRAGAVEYMTGEVRAIADGTLSVQPTLTAAAAMRAALAHVDAKQYMWEQPNEGRFAQESEGQASFRPTGELVIVDNVLSPDPLRHGRPVLAWKFNIYAAQPVSRAWVYVDARTGEVVNQDDIIKHATATVTTRYSGTRSLTNTPIAFFYNLRDNSRGLGIETYNLNRSNNMNGATDFLDANNVWTAAEYNNANQDWVAGDALFGAQQTYDYWKLEHGRNSFDGAGAKLKSYVHYDDTPGDGKGLDNAFWNGAVMLYGDGNTKFTPLTSLDVCGHEIGHAICQATSALQYQNESGGMNEGFSDIWGACVENRAAGLFGLAGKNTWLIGEEIRISGGALRSMSNPNAYGQPDTYLGTNWYPSVAVPSKSNDQGGVHTNSGVLNFWFYLLSQGGAGTNDKGNAYTVMGVGIAKAAKIAFLTEKLLSPTSNYASCRTMAIQAATTLYGATSTEVKAVTNAWYAVGIGYPVSFGATTQGYIDMVALNQLARFSGAEPGGYFDGTASTTALLPKCAKQTMLFSAGGLPVNTATRYWNAWIDYNHDNDFNDAGERILTNIATATDTWAIGEFVVPSSAQLGLARIRVMMSNSLFLGNPSNAGYIGYGEVEDYTVNVQVAQGLIAPSGLTTTGVTATAATLKWATVTGAATYNVRYRISGTVNWTLASGVSGLSRAISGLTNSRVYEFQVQAANACGTTGAFSGLAYFTTPAFRVTGTTTGDLPATPAVIEAWPNPATDALHLTLQALDPTQPAPAITDVVVYDLRGARVAAARYDGQGTLRLDGLAPGVYSATVLGGATPTQVRFVKE